MNHRDVVAFVLELYGAKKYLELGVYEGFSFYRACEMVELAVGVDVEKRISTPSNAEFYECSTDEFFAKHNKYTYDAVFIDADHRAEFVEADLKSSLSVLNAGGIIMLHDTDPDSVQLTVRGSFCSDAYRVVDGLTSMGLNHITMPLERYGITLAARDCDRRSKHI